MAALLLPALALACSDEPERKAAEQKRARAAAEPVPKAQPAPAPLPPAAPDEKGSKDAAVMLRDYYRLIGERRYSEAWALRWPSARAADRAAFARGFERYSDYRATVGTPSLPVAAGGSLYVEVPVHIYGTMKDGKPFSSGGTVTLRRDGKPGAAWRVDPN